MGDQYLVTPQDGGVVFRNTARFIFQRLLVPALCGLGSISNIVTVIVMSRPSMRGSSNLYLGTIALCDAFYLTGSLILGFQHQVGHHIGRLFNEYRRFAPLTHFLTDLASNSSVWLTVAFTVERYIVVCHPLKGKRLCTYARSKKVIVGVLSFCLLFTLPTFFEYKITTKMIPHSEAVLVMDETSSLGANETFQSVYYWLTVLIITLLPLTLLCVCNAFLVQAVAASQKTRAQMTAGASEAAESNNQVTIMCIAVVGLFIICQSPSSCLLLYSTFVTAGPTQQNILLGLGNIFNFLVCLNSAGNFCLYCLFSRKYRDTLADLLRMSFDLLRGRGGTPDGRGGNGGKYELMKLFEKKNDIGFFVANPRRKIRSATQDEDEEMVSAL